MEYAKFAIFGQDKKLLTGIKASLSSGGHIFVGYSSNNLNLIRHVRNLQPELLIIEINNNFKDIKTSIEVIDEELLAACVLLLDSRNDEVMEFIKKTRTVTYISKPIFDEMLIQIADIALTNFRRMSKYESEVKKLNDMLENRIIIEKAKWILVEREGFTEFDAYEAIRRKSRENRMSMREISDGIIIAKG